MQTSWPDIPYEPWRESCTALHLCTQMVGKYRLARTPWLNHSWHATLYVSPRGFTTGTIPDGACGIEIAFDLIDHCLIGSASDGRTARVDLGPGSMSGFHARLVDMITELGGNADFSGMPNEVPNPVAFADDHAERPYDADAVTRFFRASALVDRVMKTFRTAFLGKVSPVHLFWGSFDLAVTRFSGRLAPKHSGGVPGLPDDVTREAYSHEVSSAGFWPGGGTIDFPAFYSYAYPAPTGFSEARVEPAAAYFDKTLGEFLLPYDAVRLSPNPEATLMSFLQSTYRAAADLSGWDTNALECMVGEPGVPRRV